MLYDQLYRSFLFRLVYLLYADREISVSCLVFLVGLLELQKRVCLRQRLSKNAFEENNLWKTEIIETNIIKVMADVTREWENIVGIYALK